MLVSGCCFSLRVPLFLSRPLIRWVKVGQRPACRLTFSSFHWSTFDVSAFSHRLMLSWRGSAQGIHAHLGSVSPSISEVCCVSSSSSHLRTIDAACAIQPCKIANLMRLAKDDMSNRDTRLR